MLICWIRVQYTIHSFTPCPHNLFSIPSRIPSYPPQTLARIPFPDRASACPKAPSYAKASLSQLHKAVLVSPPQSFDLSPRPSQHLLPSSPVNIPLPSSLPPQSLASVP